MAWPNAPTSLVRPTAVSPVSSATTALILDAIEGGIHGDKVLNLSPMAIVGAVNAYTQTPMAAQLNGQCYLAIPLRQGDRIKSITFARKGNAAANLSNISLALTTAAGVDTLLINGATDLAIPAAWGDKALDPADTLIAAGSVLTLLFFPSVANVISIGATRVTYDHP